jgi:hypothetical protein
MKKSNLLLLGALLMSCSGRNYRNNLVKAPVNPLTKSDQSGSKLIKACDDDQLDLISEHNIIYQTIVNVHKTPELYEDANSIIEAESRRLKDSCVEGQSYLEDCNFQTETLGVITEKKSLWNYLDATCDRLEEFNSENVLVGVPIGENEDKKIVPWIK